MIRTTKEKKEEKERNIETTMEMTIDGMKTTPKKITK